MFYLRCLMAITKNWRHQEDTDFSRTTQTIVTHLIHFSTMITDDKEKKQPKEKGAIKEDRGPRKAGYFLEGFSAYYYTPICSLIRGLFALENVRFQKMSGFVWTTELKDNLSKHFLKR